MISNTPSLHQIHLSSRSSYSKLLFSLSSSPYSTKVFQGTLEKIQEMELNFAKQTAQSDSLKELTFARSVCYNIGSLRVSAKKPVSAAEIKESSQTLRTSLNAAHLEETNSADYETVKNELLRIEENCSFKNLSLLQNKSTEIWVPQSLSFSDLEIKNLSQKEVNQDIAKQISKGRHTMILTAGIATLLIGAFSFPNKK